MIALNLKVALGRMVYVFFTMLILLIHEHGIFSHLVWLNLLLRSLQIFIVAAVFHFLRFVPMGLFNLVWFSFKTILIVIVSLVFFSSKCLFIIYRMTIEFCLLNFYFSAWKWLYNGRRNIKTWSCFLDKSWPSYSENHSSYGYMSKSPGWNWSGQYSNMRGRGLRSFSS